MTSESKVTEGTESNTQKRKILITVSVDRIPRQVGAKRGPPQSGTPAGPPFGPLLDPPYKPPFGPHSGPPYSLSFFIFVFF